MEWYNKPNVKPMAHCILHVCEKYTPKGNTCNINMSYCYIKRLVTICVYDHR